MAQRFNDLLALYGLTEGGLYLRAEYAFTHYSTEYRERQAGRFKFVRIVSDALTQNPYGEDKITYLDSAPAQTQGQRMMRRVNAVPAVHGVLSLIEDYESLTSKEYAPIQIYRKAYELAISTGGSLQVAYDTRRGNYEMTITGITPTSSTEQAPFIVGVVMDSFGVSSLADRGMIGQ